MRILVYENTQDRAKLIKDLLDTYRYRTYVNTDNPPSLESLKSVKPSLLIVNINNPHHLELLEKIKRSNKYNRIPIIMISSLNTREQFGKFPQFCHMDYLVEPFKIKNFRHMVERWVNFRSVYVN